MRNTQLSFSIKSKHIENIIAIISFGVLAFVFLTKSPLHPWIGGTTGTDSSVFKTVTMIMEKGGMPYVDSFDHKGPLLYVLNYLGNGISRYQGIWVIEFFSLVITIFIIYRIARLICGITSSVLTTFMALSLLFGYFEQGNLTEEYAMPFIAIALYVFIDFFINNKISRIRLAICGLCFGCVMLLRPNMITVWAVMCTGVFIKKIVIDKQIRTIHFYFIWFLLGMVLIMTPMLIWLMVNGAFEQCIHDYIIFNMLYSSSDGSRAVFSAKWNSYFTFASTVVFLSSIISLVIFRKDRNIFLNYCYLFYLITTPLFICVSGMVYGHYGMVIVPAVSYPIALLLNKVESEKEHNISVILYCIVSIYCLNTIILPNWIELVKTIPSVYEDRERYHKDATISEVSSIIDGLIDEDDEISVYGNLDAIYVDSNRTHATRFSYQFPIGDVMPEIMYEYFEQLEKELPPVIVIQSGHFDDRISQFLNYHEYGLAWSQNGDSTDGALIFNR